ncbi:hypothetical protein BC938DRAFT_482856 [Jimgerdemannia flammicorona]|uniref:Uncharacterized protein n=1 Tax=Jimgerdemannia flammicorona TaxID=994334 RepID=A0A433QW70_9FUNG|nr:hypothetical protein BC938DRAFT_482856 [Jimgerdemannia flammicorona]
MIYAGELIRLTWSTLIVQLNVPSQSTSTSVGDFKTESKARRQRSHSLERRHLSQSAERSRNRQPRRRYQKQPFGSKAIGRHSLKIALVARYACCTVVLRNDHSKPFPESIRNDDCYTQNDDDDEDLQKQNDGKPQNVYASDWVSDWVRIVVKELGSETTRSFIMDL